MHDVIRIKPHHFIDLLAAIGEGRVVFMPNPAGNADFLVAHKLAKNPHSRLQIVLEEADDVCYPCQYHVQGTCRGRIDTAFLPDETVSLQPLPCRIDHRWCEYLQLDERDTLSAPELCRRIQSQAEGIAGVYADVPSGNAADLIRKLLTGVDAFLDYAASWKS